MHADGTCWKRSVRVALVFAAMCGTAPSSWADDEVDVEAHLQRIGVSRGICVVVGEPPVALPVELAEGSELTVFCQSADPEWVLAARKAADNAGLLGSQVYVAHGTSPRLHLADNIADAGIVFGDTAALPNAELLRVLRPGGKLLSGDQDLIKPVPSGAGQWSHPYHGPDNNPQSTDTIARAPYLTQFLAEPWYGPMPEVTVSSGGRLFKAFGHISFKPREWPLLNQLVAVNAYNGTELWRRDLHEGFMIHRNTMVATSEVLYVADDRSCKVIDAVTGELVDEIIPPDDVTQGKVWKWMALADGVLYAMLGDEEQSAVVLRGTRTAPGWPWSGLGKGYGQRKFPWGFGHTIMAIDAASKKVLWSHRESEDLDSRAMCMNERQLFFYSHGHFLGALDARTGDLQWKTSDSALLAAIGQHDHAQTPPLGYSTTSYVKCSEEAIYFAGPQRHRLVAASVADGHLLWQYDHGNFQLVLRDGALYALGRTGASKKFDPLTGNVLAELECYRGNCTRATGTADSIFTRGHRHTGTQRIATDGDVSTRIGLMRPACQDGVIVSGGLLYWGPWMCDCNLSLVGIISLGPAGDFDFSQQATEAARLESISGDATDVAPLKTTAADWTAYRADNARQSGTPASVAEPPKQLWSYSPSAPQDTTAAVTAGELVFVGGADGAVRAFNAADGEPRWTAYTAGAIRYPPAVWQGRVFAGSADGWIYALEATSGRQLWRFRAAPAERMISVYGRLSSTWPVAGGVLVDDGVVYAAAGIASYDGTHVYALDAVTGKIRWQNNTSGHLVEDDLVSGVSVQGHLLLHDGRLYLAGGNVVSPAVFDIENGKCLNTLDDEWQKAPRGRELFLVGERVMAFDRLLYTPKKYQHQLGRYFNESFVQASAGDVLVRGRPGQIVRLDPVSARSDKPRGLWQSRRFQRIDAVAVARDAVVAVGRTTSDSADRGESFAVAALEPRGGDVLWSETLPAAAESWGLAVDRAGRLLVTLEDGRLLCYGVE